MPRKRNILVDAATLLPLAIGLGMHAAAPEPTATTRSHRAGHAAVAEAANTHVSPLACTLPFAAIEREHDIDNSCPGEGNATSDAQAAQNAQKNNFCAAGPPVNLAFLHFQQLQDAAKSAGIHFGGPSSLPPDRSVLQNLINVGGQGVGEGTQVRVMAFVIDAHYSNVSNGESVNCGTPGNEYNDIHIVLGQNSNNDDECSSVTAEISPHHRPDVWTPDNLRGNNTHLFRFTGQVFFDASHRPCVNGNGPNPKRISLFEVHPVYAVDICADPGNACTVDSDQNWVPLSDFVRSPEPSNESQKGIPPGKWGPAVPSSFEKHGEWTTILNAWSPRLSSVRGERRSTKTGRCL